MTGHLDLPEGWKICTLKDAGKIISGGTPSTTESSYWGNDIPWITPADLSGYASKYISKGRKSISNEGLKNSSARILPKGSVLFSSRAPIGYVAIAANDLATNQGFKNITPNDDVDSNYLYYYLKNNKRLAEESASGTTFREISGSKFSGLPFIYPSISKQQQIVEKIEELFSELDKGVENLKTAQQQLKVYRQAVLKWAFEGKLTNGDQNWEDITLGKVANAVDPQPSHRTPPKFDKGVPFVSTKDFDHDSDKIDFTFARRVSPTVLDEHLNRYQLQLGDFVIGKIGTIGKPVRVVLPQNYAMSANIVLIQPRKVDPTYLYYFFQSSLIEKAFSSGKSATSQAAFGIQKVRELNIKLPPEAEQKAIVQEIESRLSVCDKMEETITNSLQQAEALRQSILKKAFEGKLVKVQKQTNREQLQTATVDNDWKRKVLAGHIVFSFQTGGYVGRTKLQKILYLCEQYAQLDYETNYVKEAAGPLDPKFFYQFLDEAKRKDWIEETAISSGYKYETSVSISQLTLDYPKYFKADSEKIKFVIKLLKDKDTDTSELIATIYAIWNNFLIEHRDLTDELLVSEVYEWDKSKVKFDKRLILSTWQWMKEESLVPVGFGKLIVKAA